MKHPSELALLIVALGIVSAAVCTMFESFKSRRPNIGYLVSAIVGSAVGYSAFALINILEVVQFESKWNFGNLVQAGSTIIIGVVVALVFQKEVQSDRKEKEIIIKHLDVTLALLDKFEDFESKMGGKYVGITAWLKKIALSCNFTSEVLKVLKYSDGLVVRAGCTDLMRTLRQLTTDSPRRKASRAKVQSTTSVQAGTIKWSDEGLAKIEEHIHKFRLEILRVQLDLNKT